MSLKAIHIVFISASILLSLGFGGWCLNNYYREFGTAMDVILGYGSFAVAVALVIYGKYFLKKLKNVGYL